MVDLREAGARLRDTHLEPPTPVPTLRRRQARRARRRRLTGAVAAAAVIGAVVLTAINLAPGSPTTQQVIAGPPTSGASRPIRTYPAPSSPATTEPIFASPSIAPLVTPGASSPSGPVPAPAVAPTPPVPGSRPVDWGDLRLSIPPGWTTQVGPVSCPQPKTVYFNTGTGFFNCAIPQPPDQTINYLDVATLQGSPPTGFVPAEVDGQQVYSSAPSANMLVYDIPTFGLQLTANGDGSEVAATLGPSTYYSLSTATYPTKIPASWKTVVYQDFSVRVPATWPVRRLRSTTFPPLGCGTAFSRSEVDLGTTEVRPTCPAPRPADVRVWTDGLWLYPFEGSKVPQPGYATKQLESSPVDLQLATITGQLDRFTDTATLTATAGSARMSVTIGLGRDPGVAEAILSSIKPLR